MPRAAILFLALLTLDLVEQLQRFRKARAQPQRLPQFWQSLFPPALHGKCECQAIMTFWGIRFVAQHLAESRNHLIDSLQIQQSESQADVGFSIVRVEPEQFTKLFHPL